MDENATKLRGKWNSKAEFLLACIGYAVGLGNIWRFPYLCYKSGGGAFLIPYFIMLVFCGVPLLYMEMAVGQLTRLGPVHAIAKLCPLLKGTGISMVLLTFVLCTYYNVIIAWALHYLFHSFSYPLPWKNCDNPWNTRFCVNEIRNYSDLMSYENETYLVANSASEEYFRNNVLQMTSGIHDMGSMRGDLVGYLILAWVICYFCLFKGVRSVGKVVYFTATFPLIILIILLVRSLTLPGSRQGILYFILPKWDQLKDRTVWMNAAVQNFNSIGIGFGSLIAFSSYNRKDNNIWHDTLAIAVINSMTSLLAGFVVFSALGNISNTLQVTIQEAVVAGPELVFVVIPQLFNFLPLPSLWSTFFFLMLIFLGLDSQFAMVEVINTSILDQFQKYLVNTPLRKELVALVVCVICFILGLPHVSQGGIYLFNLCDFYGAHLSLMFVAYFEVLAICWFYGANRLAREISFMSRYRPYYFFPFCWLFVSSFFIPQILWFNLYEFTPLQYGYYFYPAWSQAIGYLITIGILISIPIGFIHALATARGTCCQRFRKSIIPTLVTPYTKLPSEMYHQTGEGVPLQEISVSQIHPPVTTPQQVVSMPQPKATGSDVASSRDDVPSSPPPDFDTVVGSERAPFI